MHRTIEVLKWTAVGGLISFPLITLSAISLFPSLIDEVPNKKQIFGAACIEDSTLLGSGVKYCDATSEGTCGWIIFPLFHDDCSVKCPETLGPEVVGSLNHSVRGENANCDLGVDYDCLFDLGWDCRADATDILCGSYCEPKSGCPA